MRRNLIKAVLAVGDYIFMVVSLGLVLWVRYGGSYVEEQFLRHMASFSFVFVAWITIFYVLNLYDISAPFDHQHYLAAMTASVAFAVLFYYTFKNLEISPKTNLALVVAVYTVFFYPWRYIVNRMTSSFGFARPVAVVGSDQHSLELAEQLNRNRREGFRVAVVLRDGSGPLTISPALRSVAMVETVHALKEAIRAESIQTVVISPGWYDRVYQELYDLIPDRVRFFQLTTFWERLNETIPIYATDESWFLQNLNQGPIRTYQFIKRIIDLLLVAMVLPVVVPLSILSALLVKISSRGPVIFKQTRVGQNQRHFTIYKFRTMVENAEEHGAQWATENDPRITWAGRFLRKVRFDEFPQIVNVVKGEMSFVGPRPERPIFVEQLAKKVPHYPLRHLAKPGLTGWAQVKYRYASTEEDSAVKLMYDLYYVKNISFVLDIKTALKTVFIVFTGGGR